MMDITGPNDKECCLLSVETLLLPSFDAAMAAEWVQLTKRPRYAEKGFGFLEVDWQSDWASDWDHKARSKTGGIFPKLINTCQISPRRWANRTMDLRWQ